MWNKYITYVQNWLRDFSYWLSLARGPMNGILNDRGEIIDYRYL